MKTRIPPLALWLIWMLAMWGTSFFLPDKFTFSIPAQNFFICVFFLFGAITGFLSLFAFYKIKTTVDPLHPEKASSLVIIGIYKWSRNPMYLALLCVLICWGVYLEHILNSFLLFLFVWYISRFQIESEEEALRKIFGTEYNAYCQKVRRWI